LLWNLCFPGSPVEDGSSLQDLYEHALRRNRTQLTELLTRSLTVEAESLPEWCGRILSLPWQRCYTLNIDNLDEATSSKFDIPRRIVPISATRVRGAIMRACDPVRELEFIHLNGMVSDIPDDVTFSTSQYAERFARPEPMYLRFAGDLLTSPVIFIGTRLDEPPLWQHLTLRLARGSRELRELRHRSYLVTPTLDRGRAALLAEFNVEHIPMGVEEFVEKVLDDLQPAGRKGLEYISSFAVPVDGEALRLKEVSELAANPAAPNEFLLGNEPIWSDIQANRAISRECDTTLWDLTSAALKREQAKGLVVITGTAGSGKSASLMRLCLRLAADGVHVGWVDRNSNLAPRQIRTAMRVEAAPSVLAVDDADMYGPELAGWVRDLILADSRPLVIAATRSGKVDRVLSPVVLKEVPKEEIAMPHLADADINLLIDLLDRENRLGILTSKPRLEQVHAFKDQAGRQLLVAMIQATSGKKFEEKAVQELLDLEKDAQRIYALLAVATCFRFGLTRDEILIASSDFTNAALNAVQQLVGRHIAIEREGGMIWTRHRKIAEIITDELAKQGQLSETVIGLARLAAAKVAPTLRRSDRAWRMLIQFINHDFLLRNVGREVSRNLYGALESVLSWDFHFWLQRGSLEVEVGDLNLAEHFLSTTRSLSPDNVLLQTEWAYLQFKKACENPAAKEAPEWVKEASDTLESLMGRIGDHYPYHLLGSQGLGWARRGLPNSTEKEVYLKRLISKLQEGCNKYQKEKDLQQLLSDLKREYLGISVSRR
jgi:Mrp family chromosome partitioning ATPase